MQSLNKKIKSKVGSSILITMVFFLLCYFVGGSVLAAATGNGGRLAHQKEQRQEYYTQRSVAISLQEMFKIPAQTTINLIKETVITVDSQGNVTSTDSPSYSHRVDYSDEQYYDINDPADPTAVHDGNKMQKFVSDAVEELFNTKVPESVDYYGALGSSTGTGTLTVSVPGSTDTVPVTYVCKFTDNTDFGSMYFYIDATVDATTGKIDSEFCVVVPASVNEWTSSGAKNLVENGSSRITRIETHSYTITWGTPVIKKGGVVK